MVMDVLRVGRIQHARLHRGDPDRLTRIRWYPCAGGAKFLPFPHATGSVFWRGDRFGDDEPPIGFAAEVGDFTRAPNPGAAGDHFHGDPSWYLYGIPAGVEATEPPCGRQLEGEYIFQGEYIDQNLNGEFVFQGEIRPDNPFLPGEFVFQGEYAELDSREGEFVFQGEYDEAPLDGAFVFQGDYIGSSTVSISCGACTTGPTSWTFTMSGLTGDSAGLNGTWVIVYSGSGCLWTSLPSGGSVDDPRWDVRYDGTLGWLVEGSYSLLNVFARYAVSGSWSCNGPTNLTAFVSGNNYSGGPSTITVTAV